MIMSTLAHAADASGSYTDAAAPATASLLGRISKALTVRRERRALMALDDRMLADVGLSRADAYREAHRPFLDVPVCMTTSMNR
jgi:uncharacterized protein YjiS (DUF1127 family)